MNIFFITLVLSIFSSFVFAEGRILEVYSVSDYDFTLNNKSAVSIAFGKSQSNYCSVTIYKDLVVDGFSISANKNNKKSISADCSWNNKDYVQSSKHKTFVNFSIKSFDIGKKVADIEASLKLVNPYSGQFFELNNIKIEITKEKFENLIK